MKLETYKTLKEKEQIFGSKCYSRIDTVAQFKEWYDSFATENKLFRGVNEAKFKIYTSAQRYYIKHDLKKSGKKVEDVIEEELKQIKKVNGNLLKKYYELLDVQENDLLYLSFLQHYSGISPLLDFTANINKALYFMQDKLSFENKGGEDIDNYASLYWFDLESGVSGFYVEKKAINNKMSFNVMKKTSDSIVIHQQGYSLLGKKIELANLNFVAQEGRFIFHCNGVKPLEKDISYVDIHKSIAPYIKKFLEEVHSINKESIYPQEEKIAQLALQRALENI